MIRVGLVQSLIPHYREPLFAGLAQLPNIDLTVFAQLGTRQGSLRGIAGSQQFKTVHTPEYKVGPFVWDPGSIQAAKHGFDVVVFSWQSRSLLLGRAIRLAKQRGAGAVVWGHGIGRADNMLLRAKRHRTAGLADACLVYDPTTAAQLVNEGVEETKVFTAHNAIDQKQIATARDWWEERPDKLKSFQAEHAIDPTRTILFVSRIEPDKEVDLLIRAAAHGLERDPRLRLIIVGGGSARDSSKRLAQSLGIAESVAFTGPIYDEMALAPWFLSSACFAYPAAIGLSILHAFGYGLPVVTSDDLPGHNPEIAALSPGVNGQLYRADDARDFGNRIMDLIGSNQLPSMRQAALSTVQGPVGWTSDG